MLVIVFYAFKLYVNLVINRLYNLILLRGLEPWPRSL